MWESIFAPTIIFALSCCFCYFWFWSGVDLQGTQLPTLRNKRVCLLIAHPDDEAMFFAPTLLALTQSDLRNHVQILCLSSGNNEGLGEIRKKELIKSGIRLGLLKEEDVFIIDNQDFPDSMTAIWDKSKVAALLFTIFSRNIERSSPEASKETFQAAIDVLITFDSFGISRHPNHISLFHGAKYFISCLADQSLRCKSHVSLYTLKSVSILRKYTSFLDIVASIIDVTLATMKKGKNIKNQPTTLIFFSGPEQMRYAQNAMKSCHQSQMKWYRWGWIIFSRYMTINDLRLERFCEI